MCYNFIFGVVMTIPGRMPLHTSSIIISKHFGAQGNVIPPQNSFPCNPHTFCSILSKKENTLCTSYLVFRDSLLKCKWKISKVLKSCTPQNTRNQRKKKKITLLYHLYKAVFFIALFSKAIFNYSNESYLHFLFATQNLIADRCSRAAILLIRIIRFTHFFLH